MTTEKLKKRVRFWHRLSLVLMVLSLPLLIWLVWRGNIFRFGVSIIYVLTAGLSVYSSGQILKTLEQKDGDKDR